MMRNCFANIRHPRSRTVMMVCLVLDSLETSLNNKIRRWKIWLTYLEVNNAFALSF